MFSRSNNRCCCHNHPRATRKSDPENVNNQSERSVARVRGPGNRIKFYAVAGILVGLAGIVFATWYFFVLDAAFLEQAERGFTQKQAVNVVVNTRYLVYVAIPGYAVISLMSGIATLRLLKNLNSTRKP